jgi:hypothetical protein
MHDFIEAIALQALSRIRVGQALERGVGALERGVHITPRRIQQPLGDLSGGARRAVGVPCHAIHDRLERVHGSISLLSAVE